MAVMYFYLGTFSLSLKQGLPRKRSWETKTTPVYRMLVFSTSLNTTYAMCFLSKKKKDNITYLNGLMKLFITLLLLLFSVYISYLPAR